MYSTEPLTSEKYWHVTMKQEMEATRRLRNQKAIRDLMTFLVGLAAMALGVYLVEQQAYWLPIVKPWLDAIPGSFDFNGWR